MTEVISMITEYGAMVVLVGYLIWRDYRFMSKLEGMITTIVTLITKKETNDA